MLLLQYWETEDLRNPEWRTIDKSQDRAYLKTLQEKGEEILSAPCRIVDEDDVEE